MNHSLKEFTGANHKNKGLTFTFSKSIFPPHFSTYLPKGETGVLNSDPDPALTW